ncbi:hypothetical protein AVDCRST_MAG94-340, partial [uncultured Leptolyngbya sp.]
WKKLLSQLLGFTLISTLIASVVRRLHVSA